MMSRDVRDKIKEDAKRVNRNKTGLRCADLEGYIALKYEKEIKNSGEALDKFVEELSKEIDPDLYSSEEEE